MFGLIRPKKEDGHHRCKARRTELDSVDLLAVTIIILFRACLFSHTLYSCMMSL